MGEAICILFIYSGNEIPYLAISRIVMLPTQC